MPSNSECHVVGSKPCMQPGIRRPFEPGFVGECDQLVWFRVCGSSPAYLASIFTSGFLLVRLCLHLFAIWLHLEAAANRAEGISAGSYTGPPAVLSEPSEASTWDVVPPLPATPERRTKLLGHKDPRYPIPLPTTTWPGAFLIFPRLALSFAIAFQVLHPPSVQEPYVLGTLAVGQGQSSKAVSGTVYRWLHTSSVKTAMGTSVVQVPPTPSR